VWLREWGPVGYVGIGISGGLAIYGFVSLFYLAYATGRMRMALSRYADARLGSSSISPLDSLFVKRRINLADFFHPFYKSIENKVFKESELFGPALVFMGGCRLDGTSIDHCDVVVLSNSAKPFTLTNFQSCIFERCRLFQV